MHELGERLLLHVRAIWRYRWYAAAAAWAVAMAGWIAVALIPDRYQATARVYVDTQSILRPLLAGLAMQPNVKEGIEMMSRTLISRPNVEKVISMSGMDARLRNADEREDLVTRLIRELTFKGTGTQNIFTITYTDKDPQQAKRVVQSLVTLFVEGGLGEKRKDSDSARNFIDDQLKAYSERLAAAENAVADFKRRNLGLMPGQGQNFYTRLSEAQTALNQARLELTEAQQGRDAIRRQLQAEAASTQQEERAVTEDAPIEAATPEIDARIQALQQRLDTLRLSYTDRHPDIVAVLPMIEQLKDQKRRETAQKMREQQQKQREVRPKRPLPALAPAQDPSYRQLTPLAEYEANVAALTARVAEYERRLASLKSATNAIPQVEAEYTQLTRDYEVTKRNYDQLVQRREAAQLTADMQSNSGVMDFRVIDPPQVPPGPNSPNRPVLMSLVLLAALAGGIGGGFLVSQLRPTINSERRLREVGGLAVFGTVVMAWTEAQRRRERRERVALGACLLGLLSVYAAVMTTLLAHRFAILETLFRQS
jgi:polysaccharide chain length determinant protein (PEP-CTERM system associated)